MGQVSSHLSDDSISIYERKHVLVDNLEVIRSKLIRDNKQFENWYNILNQQFARYEELEDRINKIENNRRNDSFFASVYPERIGQKQEKGPMFPTKEDYTKLQNQKGGINGTLVLIDNILKNNKITLNSV